MTVPSQCEQAWPSQQGWAFVLCGRLNEALVERWLREQKVCVVSTGKGQ